VGVHARKENRDGRSTAPCRRSGGKLGTWFTASGGGIGGGLGDTGVTRGGGGPSAGGAQSGAGRVARCMGAGEEGGSRHMGRGRRVWAGGLRPAQRNSILCELFKNIQMSFN
jgi:hypothetical protein